MMDEIVCGIDELGVLLMGHAKGAYWYGSRRRSTRRAAGAVQQRDQPPGHGGVLAGVIWALENPNAGIVEPDEIDFERILDISLPYLGDMVGAYSDWTPLIDRDRLFPEDIDRSDPWQFKNFRVV